MSSGFNAIKTASGCFVVMEHSARSMRVFEDYIEPACQEAGYEASHADEQLTANIMQGVETALQTAPMSIAYLGAGPEWNANVMIELGIRLGSGLPLVILCDEQQGKERVRLPFNLKWKRAIPVPMDDEVGARDRLRVIERVISSIQETARSSPPLNSKHAVAVIQAPASLPGLGDHGQWKFINASAEADELFGWQGRLPGMSLLDFYRVCQKIMLPRDYQAFSNEQNDLIARVVLKCLPDGRSPIATIPIVIGCHPSPRFNGRAYLPIIVNDCMVADILQMTVLYLDVTAVAFPELDVNKVATPEMTWEEVLMYRCLISPDSPPLDEVLGQVTRSLAVPGPGVFLCHCSEHKPVVRQVYQRLHDHFAEPWLDCESIPPGANWTTEIERAIETCRTALVFIGPAGLSHVQQNEVIKLHNEARRPGRQLLIVPVMLPGAARPEQNFLLNTNQAVQFEDIDDDWVRRFVECHVKEDVSGTRS